MTAFSQRTRAILLERLAPGQQYRCLLLDSSPTFATPMSTPSEDHLKTIYQSEVFRISGAAPISNFDSSIFTTAEWEPNSCSCMSGMFVAHAAHIAEEFATMLQFRSGYCPSSYSRAMYKLAGGFKPVCTLQRLRGKAVCGLHNTSWSKFRMMIPKEENIMALSLHSEYETHEKGNIADNTRLFLYIVCG